MGFDHIAEALRAKPRRQILAELSDHNPVSQSETVAKNTNEKNDDFEVQLIHTHLPKLDTLGYIVWDRDDDTIVKGPHWEEIEPVIRLLDENGDQLPPDTL